MIRKLRVKLVCILMALLTVMLGVTFGLVLHFTQQSLEAESLRTLEVQQTADETVFVQRADA